MYIVGAIELGIAELEEIYSGVPLIFPKSAVNLALFVRALSPKRIDARFARNYTTQEPLTGHQWHASVA